MWPLVIINKGVKPICFKYLHVLGICYIYTFCSVGRLTLLTYLTLHLFDANILVFVFNIRSFILVKSIDNCKGLDNVWIMFGQHNHFLRQVERLTHEK